MRPDLEKYVDSFQKMEIMRTIEDIPKLIKISFNINVPYDVYIGRANDWIDLSESKWHNPFKMKNESERPKCVSDHMKYLKNNKELLNSLDELSGKVCACWCCNWKYNDPIIKRCHGHNIIEMYKKIVLGIE